MDSRDAEDRQAGIECRGCGCRDLRVIDSRKRNGKVRRIRRCRNCGRRRVTVEK